MNKNVEKFRFNYYNKKKNLNTVNMRSILGNLFQRADGW